MQFTDHFGIIRNIGDDWFDTIFGVDTRLFIDPFLIFQDAEPQWAQAHQRIVDHFGKAFRLLAKGGCTPGTAHFKAALRLLQFPEPEETCLGYTALGTRGAGSGRGFAGRIASAMCDAIGRGVTQLDHFEQLDILEEGIGPDRISDITTTILKPELIAYTQAIAAARGVPLTTHSIRAGRFDPVRQGFVTADIDLPTNPVTGGPLLLVPERFLRDLPAINATDWWDAMRSTELRDELNVDVLARVKKKDIVRIAKRHPDKVDAWVKAREAQRIEAYDLARDPAGLYQWSTATRRYARTHPLPLRAATDHAGFVAVIDAIIVKFTHFIEQQGGWRLLWDGVDEKPEEAIQLLFFGIAKAYCDANNINLDREVELGRGPVDLKFSTGYSDQALIEVKKLESGKFWNGLRTQLPSYLSSNGNRDGWLLAVRFRSTGVAEKRAQTLASEVAATAAALDLDLRYGIVDAQPKLSASKLGAKPETGVA